MICDGFRLAEDADWTELFIQLRDQDVWYGETLYKNKVNKPWGFRLFLNNQILDFIKDDSSLITPDETELIPDITPDVE